MLLAAACGDGEPAAPAPSEQGAPIQAADGGAEEEPEQVDEPEEEPAPEGDEIGLPCDVKKFLAQNCQRCHGAEAKNGTPLLTRENLLAVAKKDASKMVADRILVRVMDTEKPMPPVGKGTPVTEADIEMFLGWMDTGMRPGSCGEEFEIPAAPAAPATPATPTTPASP